MKKAFNILLFALIFLFVLKADPVRSQFAVDLESGLVVTGYNDVRIPGDQGTFFSLKDDLTPDPKIFARLNLITQLNRGIQSHCYMHLLRPDRKAVFPNRFYLKAYYFLKIPD
jgi:hypothetical protein